MGVRSIQRNIAKNKYEYLKNKEKMTLIEQKFDLFRNGITEKDLRSEFERGYGAGWVDGRERLYKGLIAAISMVYGDIEKDTDKVIEFLRKVDERVTLSIDEKDDIDEVLEKLGIELHFKNALNRIEEV